ncbi:hypothetical protein RJ641_007561 [Dillenia turbinata]|uniref:Uncharacterized protein n=1 Tax=Dillenia turbinata TaxID=194707 RepID=A0AAN8VE56_9MAGN
MRSVNNSVETINAAATAIMTAESRVLPPTVQNVMGPSLVSDDRTLLTLKFMPDKLVPQKRRWGSCWRVYWCFGSQKHNKRIGHAVLAPESVAPVPAPPVAESLSRPPAIVLPFIAPPSSPASFLQSDPPSATQSPAGLLSLTCLSVHAYSPGGPANVFSIGPYAHETQLVSPPVFSTFTTEPSTALCTPPPELVQMTTPSSPEVPYAQLLTSLDPSRRNCDASPKFAMSQSEFQPYQLYPGSPVGHLISPSSGVSNSGTSSPFPDRCPVLEFGIAEAPKFLAYENFSTHRWGPRLGSGSLTPDRAGRASRDSFLLENQISEVASLANSEHRDDIVIDHRVSFELTGEGVASCMGKEPIASVETELGLGQDIRAEGADERHEMSNNTENHCMLCDNAICSGKLKETTEEVEEPQGYQKQRSLTLGSFKEFNFESTEGETMNKPITAAEWWANEKVVGNARSHNWSFFPMLQPGVS